MSKNDESLPSVKEVVDRIEEKMHGPVVDLDLYRFNRKIESSQIDPEHLRKVLLLFGI